MTSTRRKEATLLIRWSALAIKSRKPDIRVGVGWEDVQFKFGRAYEFDADYFDSAKAALMMDRTYFVPAVVDRVDSLECQLTATDLA